MNRFRRPAIIVDDKKKIEDKIEIENDIAKQRNFQQTMYIEFLKRFINEKCEYDYQRLTHVHKVRDAYNIFLSENKELLNQYNVNYAINPKDIIKIDSRFETITIVTCKYCLNKHYKDCCDKYVRKDRTNLAYIVNLKLK